MQPDFIVNTYREYVKELLETASESGQKFLLFAHHTNVMDALEQEIKSVWAFNCVLTI